MQGVERKCKREERKEGAIEGEGHYEKECRVLREWKCSHDARGGKRKESSDGVKMEKGD